MSNVLEKIVEDKRQEIEQRKVDLPLSRFIDALEPSQRSFYDALAGEQTAFIFECKKASPSKGLIRENFDLDEILHAYRPHAAGISVLTDEKYFQGRFEYLDYVRNNVSQPVLNKDFFIDPYQIYLARHHNADAVLLMLSVLSDGEYQHLAQLAEKFNLDVLTEVSNEEEVERAVALNANIIGINNRNLRDLSTDLATTERLVPMLRAAGHRGMIISESGIYTHQDVRRLSPLVDGFLVGSSLMAEQDVARATHALVYGKVKVCGITQLEDAQEVRTQGASFAGLIFAPKSKRCLTLAQALEIVANVPFCYIGVFVNQPVVMVCDYAEKLNLVGVQLHGNEDQAYVDELRQRLPAACKIIKAVGVSQSIGELSLKQIDHYLLDCQVGDQSGGTGQQFDWTLLDSIDDKGSLFLAGGIGPHNISEARKTGVGVLDINSAVESAPGKKDKNKLKQSFAALRNY